MSSVRGGGYRGRGRGSSQPAAPSARGSTTHGRGSSSNASRGNTSQASNFTRPSSQSANPFQQGQNVRPGTGMFPPSSQSSVFRTGKTKGSWQERYQTLMKARERERAEAIRHGQIADPDKPRSLSEAVTPTGTCQEMCAEYERVQRVVQKDVWDEELDPNVSAYANTDREPDEARMVKKFRRAAAGLEEQLPSDLRPPHILKRTCDYLFNDVVGTATTLAQVHHFVWDRTRAIRNDFSIQQVTKPDELQMAIECYERIARFHILSLHQLAGPHKPYSKYDVQQEREQLDRTLLSLMQYYDDSRGRIVNPNEAEFRAYCVIFQLQDPSPDLEDRVQTWPKAILLDGRVQNAVDLYMAACNVMDPQGPLKPRANHLIARQDWQHFWTLVASNQISYLMACVAEIYFNLVRRTVLNALFRAFRMNSSLATPDWTLDTLCNLLVFDDEDDVFTYCEQFGFSFKERDDGQQYLDLNSVRGRTLPEPNTGIGKQTKSELVEHKRCGRTLPAVINGLSVERAQSLGLINDDDKESEHDENMDESMRSAVSNGESTRESVDLVTGMADEDPNSLFVPETPNFSFRQPQAPSLFTNANPDGPRSPFSAASTGNSTFGKPSPFASGPSVFANRQSNAGQAASSSFNTKNTPGFDFRNPAVSESTDTQRTSPTFDAYDEVEKDSTETKETETAKSLFAQPLPESNRSVFSTLTPAKQTPSTPSKQTSSTPSKPSFGQPSTATSSVLAAPASSFQPTPFFSFTPPPKSEASDPRIDASHETHQSPPSPAFAVESRSPSPEPPKAHFLPSGSKADAPATPAASSISATSQGESQTHPISQSNSHSPIATSPSVTSNAQSNTPSNLGSGLKRPSFSADTKPKKPSPLSNSITAGEANSTTITEPAPTDSTRRRSDSSQTLPHAKHTEASKTNLLNKDWDLLVSRLSDDLFNDPDVGLLRQYLEYAVAQVTHEVFDTYTHEQNLLQADEFRQDFLSRKYSKKWRDIFWQRRLAKTGRERRERRQRRLQHRESLDSDSSSIYRADSLDRSSRGSLTQAQFDRREEMGSSISGRILGGSVVNNQHNVTTSKRPISAGGEEELNQTNGHGHKRLKSTSHVDPRGRIVKPTSTSHPTDDFFKRSAFLGFSVAKHSTGNTKNTTMSDYFRHKAMGLGRMETTIGQHGTKRRFESLQTASETSPPALRSSVLSRYSSEQNKSRSTMAPPSSTPSRVAKVHQEDEALFARLKTARESLQEGMSFFKSASSKNGTLQHSLSSQSSTDTPFMDQAKVVARMRASRGVSTSGGQAQGSNVPAYRLRESRFVRREDYPKALERAQEIRASRSRETSRPESRVDQHGSVDVSHAADKSDDMTLSIDPSLDMNGLPRDQQGTSPNTLSQMSPKPFEFAPHVPPSFGNHTTHTSSENPFLKSHVQGAASSLGPQAHLGFNDQEAPSTEDRYTQDIRNVHPELIDMPQERDIKSHDHTINPSQIQKSLSASFGASGFAAAPFGSFSHVNENHPNQDSRAQTQAISLLSDDEDDEAASEQAPLEHGDALHQFAGEDVWGQAAEHETYEMYHGERSARSQDSDSVVEDEEDGDDEDAEDDVNGYIDEEDGYHDGIDGDIDEYESDIEDEDMEDGEESDEEEDSEAGYDPRLKLFPAEMNRIRGRPPPPPKNPALQHVGNTAEEAIELSD